MAKKIKVNIFDDLKEALQDVAAYERGEPVNLRVTRVPARPKPISPRNSPHPPRPQRQPAALRHLLERQRQRRPQLGAGHPPPPPGRPQTPHHRKEKPQSSASRLSLDRPEAGAPQSRCLGLSGRYSLASFLELQYPLPNLWNGTH